MSKYFGIWLMLIAVVGCENLPDQPELNGEPVPQSAIREAGVREAAIREAAIQEAEEARLQIQRQREINYLLAMAEAALSNDRLMQPKQDNAYDWYQQVLALDGSHSKAHAGMRQITARYLELAEQAYSEGMYQRAHLMLDGAENVSALPAEIATLRERYKLPPAQPASDNEFVLPGQELTQRSETLSDSLSDITERAVAAESRLLIIARNDAEGRWIYQQMRNFAQGYRLRGNIQLGKQPKIVLLDL